MPKKIDVKERKELILQAALKVFEREGYRDANLSTIAEEVGISRPTLYNYFSDKNDIFYYAVKLVTGKMFAKYSKIAFDESIGDELERIEWMVNDVLDFAASNDIALANLLEFMLSEKKRGVDFAQIIDKRTAKFQILIKRLLKAGIERGTIRECNVQEVGKNFFNLIESACFQVAFFKTYEVPLAKKLVSSYIGFYKI